MPAVSDWRRRPKTEAELARYITLEHGIDIEDGGEYPVLCEWRHRSHLNMGEAPDTTIGGFLQSLTDLIGHD